jgi:hypothetical protein
MIPVQKTRTKKKFHKNNPMSILFEDFPLEFWTHQILPPLEYPDWECFDPFRSCDSQPTEEDISSSSGPCSESPDPMPPENSLRMPSFWTKSFLPMHVPLEPKEQYLRVTGANKVALLKHDDIVGETLRFYIIDSKGGPVNCTGECKKEYFMRLGENKSAIKKKYRLYRECTCTEVTRRLQKYIVYEYEDIYSRSHFKRYAINWNHPYKGLKLSKKKRLRE